MVWNVTKEDIRVRTVKPIDEAWPPPPAKAPPPIDQSLMKVVSKEIGAGAWDVKDVDQTIYDRINKKYGTNFKQRER